MTEETASSQRSLLDDMRANHAANGQLSQLYDALLGKNADPNLMDRLVEDSFRYQRNRRIRQFVYRWAAFLAITVLTVDGLYHLVW